MSGSVLRAERIRICASLPAITPNRVHRQLQAARRADADLIEVRLDYARIAQLREVWPLLRAVRDQCILTCRSRQEGGQFRGTERQRRAILRGAAELEPAYVDVELNTLQAENGFAVDFPPKRLLVSSHFVTRTPDARVLGERVTQAAQWGSITKVVTHARRLTDNATVLQLYRRPQPKPLIAFCTGPLGVFSRILCLVSGAPFTYASLPEQPTAPGQPSIGELRALVTSLAN